MSFALQIDDTKITVRLAGWDRAMNGRRTVQFDLTDVSSVHVAARSSLESLVTHRALGCGTHNGSKRPNGRRIGTMLASGVGGKQFWALAPTAGDELVLVLDLKNGEFQRAVLSPEDPKAMADQIRRSLKGT